MLSLAGVLTERPVRLEGERVRDTKVKINDGLEGAKVTLDELKLLLAAHRL